VAQDTNVVPTITASGTTWTQYKTGGLKVVIDNAIAQNLAKANPTVQATTAETVAAGGLAAGTYYCAYTFVDAFGETTIGTSESAQFTVTDTSHRTTVTLPVKPTGVQSMNLYVTPLGGASGSETLWATGITATTFALTDSYPADMAGAAVPVANTTGADMHISRIYSLMAMPQSEKVLFRLTEDLSTQLSGMPMQRSQWLGKIRSWEGILKLWSTCLAEIAVLVWANIPTASTTTFDARGMPVTRWTLP